MVLAAGLGTRLRPLSEERAKPLLPVGDAPAIAHAVRALRAAKIARVVANAFHRAEEVVAFGGEEGVAVSVEGRLLGTAGGVAHAAALLGPGDVLVYNGDIFADLDLGALLAAHTAEATLAVRPGAKGAGNVGLDAAGRVVRLRRESFAEEARGGEFLGIHLLGASLRASLPEEGCLVGDVYLPALRRGAELRAFETDASFCDIGTLAGYLAANRGWLARRGLAAWAAPGAAVASGVTLEASVVGEGARVTGEGALTRTVVWPGAAAVAPLADAVVTPRGIVRLPA